MPVRDSNVFLDEEKRSFREKFDELAKQFPSGGKLITVAEANLLVVVLHSTQLAQHYHDGVNYIESMLHKQVVSAIGKEVGPSDFAQYMTFHNRKLFKSQYQPNPFCYAIRRPDHYPEGTLSIEGQLDDGALADPVFTTVRHIERGHPMFFPINAATKVAFTGEHFLHAYIAQEFSGYSGTTSLNLVARARQFSSFLMLVGRLASPHEFDPKFGIIIQNKDEIIIPLLLEQLPTPKEFRDAIESLSPEQQRFCKAFRSMQLEGSVFAVCIIQLKPQLEKLLKIPDDSLTKEIRLTQDLLELFIKYQIPSDLLTYDGDLNAEPHVKIEKVKNYVATMYEMIEKSKKKEIVEVAQQAVYQELAPPLRTNLLCISNQ